WSTAMAIQMGEARYRYGLEDSFEEGMKEGIIKGREEGEQLFLNRMMESKYHEDCSAWLCTLSTAQMEQIFNLILTCDTLGEVKTQLVTPE
ncbi:MAG: hypothetical protein E7A27_07780, partial [Erysipelotrichaceae bacterium]|nr:hypothetical protein [Erysipelotrichaceae bacterium]MDU1119670.1 hypothetical protein [Erysipelotrichaceae bacterium]